MKTVTALSMALSMASAFSSSAQAQDGPEPVLPPASGDFVSTTVAEIEDTPLFYIAANDLLQTMNRYKTMRDSGDCTPQITQDLKDAKAMADAARVNEWNSFNRLQKDYVTYARSQSGAFAHFRDRIRTPQDHIDTTAAAIFAASDREYPMYMVLYQVFSQMDNVFCNPDGTSKNSPQP